MLIQCIQNNVLLYTCVFRSVLVKMSIRGRKRKKSPFLSLERKRARERKKEREIEQERGREEEGERKRAREREQESESEREERERDSLSRSLSFFFSVSFPLSLSSLTRSLSLSPKILHFLRSGIAGSRKFCYPGTNYVLHNHHGLFMHQLLHLMSSKLAMNDQTVSYTHLTLPTTPYV